MPVQCDNAPAGSHLKGMLAALWNALARDLEFRGGQRRTTQTIPLRFAAATLLRYCAYSIETQLLRSQGRRASSQCIHATKHNSPELGTRPSILSLLRIASGSFGDVPGFPQDCALCLVPGCHTLPPVLYEAEAPRSFRADLCPVPLVMPLVDGSKSLLGQHQPQ